MSDKPTSAARLSKRRSTVWRFLYGVERSQRIRIQRDMWKLCTENRALRGKYWRTVLKRYDLAESDVWPNASGEGRKPAPERTA